MGHLYSEEGHPGASGTPCDPLHSTRLCTSLILPKPPFFKISVKGVRSGAGKLAENDLERTCALDSEAMGLKPTSLSPQEIRLCSPFFLSCTRVNSVLTGVVCR